MGRGILSFTVHLFKMFNYLDYSTKTADYIIAKLSKT